MPSASTCTLYPPSIKSCQGGEKRAKAREDAKEGLSQVPARFAAHRRAPARVPTPSATSIRGSFLQQSSEMVKVSIRTSMPSSNTSLRSGWSLSRVCRTWSVSIENLSFSNTRTPSAPSRPTSAADVPRVLLVVVVRRASCSRLSVVIHAPVWPSLFGFCSVTSTGTCNNGAAFTCRQTRKWL